MPDGHVLDFSGVTKRFGAVAAVDGFTARVEPGVVTGFLGPNGAGKTTTLRMLLGLVRPDAGAALIGGERYAQLRHPLQTVGAVLEASSYHPGRSAANHLKVYAQAASLPESRVDEVLGLVGLADVAGRRIGGFSLGMRQRLGLAYALLGDPGVLVLDEPSNGLDPEGIKWMRGFLRQLAAEGRTVFVSSHLLAEVAQTVDALLIISRGRLVFQGEIADLADPAEFATVVDAPDRAALVAAMAAAGIAGEVLRTGLTVRGHSTEEIGRVAAEAGVALSSLQRKGPAFEEVFLELVNGVRTHPSASGLPAPRPAPEPAAEPEPAPEPESAPEPASTVPQPEPDAQPQPGSAIASVTAPDEAPAPAPDDAPAPAPAADRSFSVASTGVIDVIGPEDDGPGGDPTTETGEAR